MPDARELPPPDGPPLFDAGSPAGESAGRGSAEQPPEPPSAPAASLDTAAWQPSLADRLLSFGEVVMCSGFPTQLAVTVLLLAAGISALDDHGGLSLRYVVWLSAIDTVLVIGLATFFLRLRGERPAVVLLGTRPPLAEAARGLLLLAPTFLLLITAALLIERAAPWLRSTQRNPFEALLKTPTGLVAFAAVAIFAGGLREEIQRAFVLHRFGQHLGGVWLGLVLFSLAFGAGHALQGWDAAVMTGVLGAFWGYVYIRRRSIVAPVACHAAFNLLEVAFHGLQA